MVPKHHYRPRSVRRLEKKAKRNLILSISIFLILGYFLFSWGIPVIIGGLSVFNKFKPAQISEKVEDTGLAPPVLNIPFESTNSAKIKIAGYATQNSKVEIYLDDNLATELSTDSDGKFDTDELTLTEGINNIHGVTKNDDKKSLPSKTIKISYSNDTPQLELSEPNDGQEIKGSDKKVRVSGKVDNQNPVTVNGVTVVVNSDGNFQTSIPLNDGENLIIISATNDFGNNIKIERKVKYSP